VTTILSSRTNGPCEKWESTGRDGDDVEGDLSFAGNIEWREAHTLRRWA
jgi:hypothetical protein